MKKLIRSVVVLAAMAMMTLGMSTLVSAVEPAVTIKENVVYGDPTTVGSYTWNQNDNIDSIEQGRIIPIVINKPGVLLIVVNNCVIESDAYVGIYQDQACKQTEWLRSINAGTTGVSGYVNIKTAGTYYLSLSTISTDKVYTNTANVAFTFVTNSEKTAQVGKQYYIASKDYSEAHYFKYTATATGYIGVATASVNNYGCYAELLNAKKTVISEKEYLSSSNSYFTAYAVKKGQTYYIRISSMASDEMYFFAVSQKAVKEKSGKTKKKAVTLKAKKIVKGTVLLGEKADWYKLKLKKKKSLTITMNVMEQNNLKVTLYNGKGKVIDSPSVLRTGKNTFKVTYGSTFHKANKGTYYLKVERDGKKSSGYYDIKWK